MITSIKWKNHEILGNLELDFRKPDGTAFNTIILAGENGAGKTTILETVGTFLNLGSMSGFDNLKYEVNGEKYTITPLEDRSDFGFHMRKKESNGDEVKVLTNRHNAFDKLKSDLEDIRHYGCAYSKARSGFSTKKVISTTTQQLDDSKYEDDSTEDYTKIKQLIVDIDAQDNSDWMEVSIAGTAPIIEEFQQNSRLYRFKNAFNQFFDSMEFKKIDSSFADEKRIIFEKHGNPIPLDSLSTGEKQIVFRGAYLLRNSNSLQDGVVLIDEPELSMHPKWQDKILKYYRDLFTDNGSQSTQMIFSTHSEYVIRAALEDPDNVLVIILKDDNGKVVPSCTEERVLPTLVASEVNYLAFGIESIDYHIALYGRLQLMENKHSVAACDNFIAQHHDYDSNIHGKTDTSQYGNFKTWPTYIRNTIDHPDSNRHYTPEEFHKSIQLLRKMCYPYRNTR